MGQPQNVNSFVDGQGKCAKRPGQSAETPESGDLEPSLGQYNRVHVMQQTPETELLQRQCEAERRRARAKLVARLRR